MTVLFGLIAAILYGTADFTGGLGSRRVSVVTVVLYSEIVGALLVLALLPLLPGEFSGRVLLFGLLGGAAGLLGIMVLYSLMTVAPINVVSPVTAVLAAMVPVAVGVVTGERPRLLAWAGIALGLIAVVLVSRTREDHPHGRVGPKILALAVVSGLGFGLYFVFLDRAGETSGLWPLVVSRLGAALVILPVARARRAARRVRGRLLGILVLTGVCDALANLFFLLAAREGLLSLASVLTSLYPATTVVLAVWLLRERTTPIQRVGLALAAGAVVLITV